MEKARADTNSRLKNFCMQKNIKLLSNEHVVIKLHLNRKGVEALRKGMRPFSNSKLWM